MIVANVLLLSSLMPPLQHFFYVSDIRGIEYIFNYYCSCIYATTLGYD